MIDATNEVRADTGGWVIPKRFAASPLRLLSTWHLGRLPAADESLVWRDLRFEVMDIDGQRIDKVLITVLPKPEVDEEDG